MAACKPARQCALIFPSGKRCGSPALRNQPHCFHHANNHRAFTRDRFLCDRLGLIRDKLDQMSTSELLNFLHQKLCSLPKTMTRFPEISFTLTYTSTASSRKIPRNQESTKFLNRFRNLPMALL